MTPYLLISADFVKTGGMDRANYALASYLASQGHPVRLVAYRTAADLVARRTIRVHRVRQLGGSYFLSEPLLDQAGRRLAKEALKRCGRVVVNGGNCLCPDVNWVHYVHAAHPPFPPLAKGGTGGVAGSLLRRSKEIVSRKLFLHMERRALERARLVIANSARTARDIVELIGIPKARVRTVYYGSDPAEFRPADDAERVRLRSKLTWPLGKPFVAFVGALGDRRKGFDTLFAAWQVLCGDWRWDADLVVVGTGAELPHWKSRAAHEGIGARIHFLGFRSDIPEIVRACDAFVAPTRYEAYGLAVHEALCCGLPAIVSANAGVAERFPPSLRSLLLPDPENVNDLVERLRDWREHAAWYRTAAVRFSESLRAYTWDDMAARMVELMEQAA